MIFCCAEVTYGNKENCQSQDPHGLTDPSKNHKERKKRPDHGKISQRLNPALFEESRYSILLVSAIDGGYFSTGFTTDSH